MDFEFVILHWIQELHTPWMDTFMTAVTSLGNAGMFWILLGVGLLCGKKTRTAGLGVLISLLLGLLLGNMILKNVFMRQRPCWIQPEIPLLIAVPEDYSFPSGHTLASVEGALGVFFYNKKWGIAALVLAALIAFSRMYLFVHFPTDILGGALLGCFTAWLANKVLVPKLFRSVRK